MIKVQPVAAALIMVAAADCSPGGDAAGDGSRLEQIYEPVRVGTPPENAFHGLVRLPEGELRHYGYRGPQSGPDEYYYIVSRDNGLTWSDPGVTLEGSDRTGESGPPAARSPWSGAWIRIVSTRNEGTFVLRGTEGIDGPYERKKIHDGHFIMIRQPVFLRSRQRMLVTAHHRIELGGKRVSESCVFYSDDDGRSWELARVPVGPTHRAVWPHEKTRWENNAVEPTVAELGDGRLWMLLRTSMNRLYESFSGDGGETWSGPAPSRFYSTLTMPTFFRMRDGRLVLLWCNTTPLPEVDRTGDESIRPEQRNGLWEDVFTNRDAIHAAVSEDDGASWRGFRELYLNPLRNESDFATSGGNLVSLDKSVHQSQAVELPHGKLLVALGQHPLVRSLVIFDPDWLFETVREDDFSGGKADWSTFKYLRGIKGHCAYDRLPGAPLVDHPDDPGSRALHLRRPANQELVCERDGAVWNFPAGMKGRFTTRIRLLPGGQGGRICLMDRWFNPVDTLAYCFSQYSVAFGGDGALHTGEKALTPGNWHELRFEWDDAGSAGCNLYVDGEPLGRKLELNLPSVNGISYVHFQSTAESEDMRGFLVDRVRAEAGSRENRR